MRVAKFTISIKFEIVVPAEGVSSEDISSKDIGELKQDLLDEWTGNIKQFGKIIDADVEVALADI